MAARKALLSTAAALIPPSSSLTQIREIAQGCQACDLWRKGTQTVFGKGKARASVMFVGEQPGNDEDLEGEPFVGPAGKLLDKALEEAGIDRGLAYVTNVVKHFKWEPRGKRRIHAKPNAQEITACLPWLQAEIRLVKPELLVCLGATAAQALFGRAFRVTQQRGVLMDAPFARKAMATVHPSSILRAPDEDARRLEMQKFIDDLQNAANYLKHEMNRSVSQVSL
ncbi:MAG TPA: UdgX family uracil-DNA binding protein [Bryobacteraceae bacterium]|nr:UdgX family uracil-DNA binding protein [Bryobacteraceae bacterium]